ncbi:MAG: PEP-utilizing enzyme [Candidatus Kerfeldbacteria bacterium]
MKTSFTIVAHDVNSPLIRNELWVRYPILWKKLFGLPIARVAIWSKNDMISYCLNDRSWVAPKKQFIRRIERDLNYLHDIIDRTNRWGEEMNAVTEIATTALFRVWSPEELMHFFDEFVRLQTRQYAIGVLLPLLDFIGKSYIENSIQTFLTSRLPPQQAADAFSLFTAPANKSFALEQEDALLRIAQRLFRVPSIKRMLSTKKPAEVLRHLRSKHQSLASLIEKHAKRFGWVYYVYAGPAYEPKDFIGFIQDWLRRGIDPKRELKKRAAEQQMVRKRRNTLLKKLKPDRLSRALLKLAPVIVWAKPRRKDYQSKTYWHMEFFYREIARRYKYSLQQVRSATTRQLYSILHGRRVASALLDRQRREHVTYNDAHGMHVLTGNAAAQFAKQHFHEEQHETSSDGQLSGTVAYQGSSTGTVRIINTPDDMIKMHRGDILVSFATTPSIVPAMKKASAIVTDEGGLTCHAAIVSRELKIPCVVGTKISTKVLKDGDRVEVDADKGIVRKRI